MTGNGTAKRTGRSVGDVRINAFAALVMLLVEYALGTWVNLDEKIPQADRGSAPITAFFRAITSGPIGLSIHAIIGTLLILGAIAAVLRAVRAGAWIVTTAVALLAVVVAWLGGTRFVATGDSAPSLIMALMTAVALFCYALILVRAEVHGAPER
ncbi:MAG: hypothetical protein ACRENL_10605 [Candidatus Dormibacteria bacterium]